MSRPIGSGKKQVYVSFRTSIARYNRMLAIGKELGFKKGTKSKVYRTAERLLIRKYGKKGDE